MDKETQRIAWSCLPKEFKEEVKELYDGCIKMMDIRPSASEIYANKLSTLEGLFGLHNLTTDAEGDDDEMLCVSRKDMQFYYQYYKTKRESESSAEQKAYYKGRTKVLLDLFGSKCLPDEEPLFSNQPENYNNENLIVANDNKPTEPKFKMGDTASYVCSPTLKHKCTVTKVMQNGHSGKWEYNVIFEWGKPGMWIPESDLEPCTSQDPIPPKSGELKPQTAETQLKEERTEPTCTADCPSPRPSQHFDDIISRDFADHNRLHIAAMAMAGLLANEGVTCFTDVQEHEHMDFTIYHAFEYADKLIKKSKEDEEQ